MATHAISGSSVLIAVLIACSSNDKPGLEGPAGAATTGATSNGSSTGGGSTSGAAGSGGAAANTSANGTSSSGGSGGSSGTSEATNGTGAGAGAAGAAGALGAAGMAGAAGAASGLEIVSLDGQTVGQPCALERGGQLWCVEPPAQGAPEFVFMGAYPGAEQVVRGAGVACLRYESGRVQCSGRGGQVGDGTTDATSTPVDVLGVEDAIHIDSWVGHTCVAHRTGGVSCWGDNSLEQIQVGGDSAYPAPHLIAGVDSAVQVATSRLASCALQGSGTVLCWSDDFGATPTAVDGIDDAISITAGQFHFCVTSLSGKLTCFGGSRAGQEATVPEAISDAAEAIAFHSETCYRSHAGRVFCWGVSGMPGQAQTPPLEPVLGIQDAVLLANHCALRAGGVISCWSERTELVDATGL